MIAITPSAVLERRLEGDGVDQPRLTTGQLPDCGLGVAGEFLAGFRGVLGKQGLDIVWREVAEPQGLGADVEGTPSGDDRVLGRRLDPIVAHVPDAAQDDALRETPRAFRIAGAELAQHRDQRVADQRVDLVEHEDQRSGARLAPTRQQFAQGVVRAGGVENVGPDLGDESVVERLARASCQGAQDGAYRGADVLSRRLPSLDVDICAPVLVVGVQRVAQREQC